MRYVALKRCDRLAGALHRLVTFKLLQQFEEIIKKTKVATFLPFKTSECR